MTIPEQWRLISQISRHARKNLTGDPYYTDGLRVVLFLSKDLVDVQNIQRLDWELPPQPPLDVEALETLDKR